jgi:transposase-like protein
MARKAIVDRNIVLQLLKEGKTSQSIAAQFGVSRQAIDLHRKEFTRTGLLPGSATPLSVTTTAPQTPLTSASPVPSKPLSRSIEPHDVSLDQMIDLIIRAFDALKRIPELEVEMEKYRREYDGLNSKIQQLEEREKKRKEQEARWIHAQNPDVLSNR